MSEFSLNFIRINFKYFFRLLPGNIAWHDALKTRVISANVFRLMNTQFIYYCNYLTSRISFFNNELEITAKNSEKSQNEKGFSEKLNLLKVLDMKLMELSLLVREYFKLMLMLTTTVDLIVIVISIYWIYGGFIFGNNPYFTRE